jgi:hypothetical protein
MEEQPSTAPPATTETAMTRTATIRTAVSHTAVSRTATPGPGDSLGRGSVVRRARRVLERELADYATVADRDDLAALLDGRGSSESLAADVLGRQAHRALFRTN